MKNPENLTETDKYHMLLKEFMLMKLKPRTTWTLLKVMANDAIFKAEFISMKKGLGNGWTGEDELQVEAGRLLHAVEAFRECAERKYLKGIQTEVF